MQSPNAQLGTLLISIGVSNTNVDGYEFDYIVCASTPPLKF